MVCSVPSDPALRALLEAHPEFEPTGTPAEGLTVRWEQGDWRRSVTAGSTATEVRGLAELMDNNPLVCADVASVPSQVGTLALIALGPLARAALLVEAPALRANQDDPSLDSWLATEGWSGGTVFEADRADLGSVLAVTAWAVVPTPDAPEELAELYDEAFSRSFYVRRDQDSDWDTRLVAGRPWACYRLAVTPDDPHCLIRVQVMADRNGKAGAAQVVHALNVMCGFEESLGIPELLPV
ncbi:MAG: hypothetical protein KF884_05135 [Fimbriimonadaceae bacterium]|nr:hypothetical protein [Fimbriimonadaceae bacterium]QYK59469.1 MAG: hypothetical protein KF884_05135 [Fimbriimonadaceae bacterium]